LDMLSFSLEHPMSVNRSDLIAHLSRTRFSPGDASGARRDAENIARFLKDRYGAEVWGIGSLFEELRPFRKGSDIDLVAKGIPTDRFFEVLAEVEDQTKFSVDLIPWEGANDLIREIVLTSGVRL
jgi:predicted nucleotidyltransferase